MRRYLLVAAAFLCLSVTACDKSDEERAIQAANTAADAASSSPIPWLQVAGTLGSIALGATGLRRANRATAFTDGEWDRNEAAELVGKLREYGYKIEGPA